MRASNDIDGYVGEVARRVSLPRAARTSALADLREGLRAAALDLGPDEAIRRFGPAAATADRLQADYGDPSRRSSWPIGVAPRTLAARARAAMDPSGPWFVPRVVGIGWDLNLGRLARTLGLLGYDDLDDDVAGAVPATAWWWALAAVTTPATLAVAVSASAMATMRLAPAHWPLTGPADRWAPPGVAFAPTLVFAAAAEGLALAALWTRLDLPVRLALVGFGAAGAVMALSAAIMTRWFGRAPGVWSFLGLAVSAVGAASLAGLVVRAGRVRVLAR